jgi:hypothetical protein
MTVGGAATKPSGRRLHARASDVHPSPGPTAAKETMATALEQIANSLRHLYPRPAVDQVCRFAAGGRAGSQGASTRRPPPL